MVTGVSVLIRDFSESSGGMKLFTKILATVCDALDSGRRHCFL